MLGTKPLLSQSRSESALNRCQEVDNFFSNVPMVCDWHAEFDTYPCFSRFSSSSRHLIAIFLFLSWSAAPLMFGNLGFGGNTLGNKSLLPLVSAPIIMGMLQGVNSDQIFSVTWSQLFSAIVSWWQVCIDWSLSASLAESLWLLIISTRVVPQCSTVRSDSSPRSSTVPLTDSNNARPRPTINNKEI